jgi:hypothetical protein
MARLVRGSLFGFVSSRLSSREPPSPGILRSHKLMIPLLDLVSQQCTPLVLLLPVFRPVQFPILAKRSRKRLGKKKKLDIVTAWRQILLVTAFLLIFVGQYQRGMGVARDLEFLLHLAQKARLDVAVG